MSKSIDARTKKMIAAAKRLRDAVDDLDFDEPVTHIYNPLRYAWSAHRAYLELTNPAMTEVLFLGMNPGPWGMAQTGVPFGEIAAVRDWMGIEVPVKRPPDEHPKRPIEGFKCGRSEVSGRRLWGLFQQRFKSADRFFERHFVANYCPLVFMESTARNRTPDKLASDERTALDAVCDEHLRAILEILDPKHVVGVGTYAEKALQRTVADSNGSSQVSRILHPSPASPAANRDWAGTATQQLKEAGIWN